MNNYAEYYYAQTFGCIPTMIGVETEQTEKTIAYLVGNGLRDDEIYAVLDEISCKPHPPVKITPEDLPGRLWNDSLIERGEFYYHRLLQIKPPAPVFNLKENKITAEKDYLEIRIRFTLKHLLEYFTRRTRIDEVLIDEQRDLGSLKYLLQKYSKISVVRPLDFVLMLIDEAFETHTQLNGVFDIQGNEAVVLERVKRMTAEAAVSGSNRIIWR